MKDECTMEFLYGIIGGMGVAAALAIAGQSSPKLQRRASGNRSRVKSNWLASVTGSGQATTGGTCAVTGCS